MDIEQIRIRMGEMAAEIERLQSIIDEDNAQEPECMANIASEVHNMVLALPDGEYPQWDQIYDVLSAHKFYARPIPAQQSPALETTDLFSADQWWVSELYDATKNGTPDQQRAYCVVLNLLRQVKQSPAVAVQICDECDIASCKHVKNKTLQIIANASPRITVAEVAVPDSCLKQQNLPIEALIEEYTHEGCDFTDITWVNAASLRYVESMEDGQLKCLIYSLINLQSPRITEQDAREIAYSALCSVAYDSEVYISEWMAGKCPLLLNKLNEANNAR